MSKFKKFYRAIGGGPRRWARGVFTRYGLADPHLTAKFYPIAPGEESFMIGRSDPASARAGIGLPVPPQALWLGYGRSEGEYLTSGQQRSIRLRAMLRESGFELAKHHRLLDFGCASGIVLRWFVDLADAGEAWGVDIAAKPISWCQANLSPPFRFATTTSFPHLPFEDHYFDVIHAGSVFTHIADLADAWLLELRRITRPGGRLVVTVHDNHHLKRVLDGELDGRNSLRKLVRNFDRKTGVLSSGFSMFAVNRVPGHGGPGDAQVFYDLDYLHRQWGRVLKIVAVNPGGFGGPQTVLILEKHNGR